jgi:cell division protein FtsL
MQKLLQAQKSLQEEIDKLKAEKATLLNLDRVEKEVMKKLGYRYPEPEQLIKIFVQAK